MCLKTSLCFKRMSRKLTAKKQRKLAYAELCATVASFLLVPKVADLRLVQDSLHTTTDCSVDPRLKARFLTIIRHLTPSVKTKMV